MKTDAETAEWTRRVADLLNKTIEKGATAEEEKSAVQLAYLLTRQHRLDIDMFKAMLGMVGSPPRYLVTSDGFLVPYAVAPRGHGADWDGVERRRARPARECSESPSGQHRMVPLMRGTFPTGFDHCLHCGFRKPRES